MGAADREHVQHQPIRARRGLRGQDRCPAQRQDAGHRRQQAGTVARDHQQIPQVGAAVAIGAHTNLAIGERCLSQQTQMAGDERRRAGKYVAPRQAWHEWQQRVHLAPLQFTNDARAVVVQRAGTPRTYFFRLTQCRFEPAEQLAHEVGFPGRPGRRSRSRRQVVRDGYQEQQAEPLAIVNAGCQLQEQVFVVQVAAGGGVGEQSIVADDEAECLAGVVGYAESPAHGHRRFSAELVQQHAEVQPVASAERAPGSLGEGVARFRPFVQAAQGKEAVAVQGKIVGARLPRLTPDRHQLGDIAAEQRGDVEEIPGAPIRRAQKKPELLERRLVPTDRRAWLGGPGQEGGIRWGEPDQIGYPEAETRCALEGRQPFGDQLAATHCQTQAQLAIVTAG